LYKFNLVPTGPIDCMHAISSVPSVLPPLHQSNSVRHLKWVFYELALKFCL